MRTPLEEISADQTAAWIFFSVAAAYFVVSLVGAARERRRVGTAVPLLALAGGAVASLEESWIDTLIQLHYPDDSPLVAFTAFGNAQPLYLHIIYPGFIGLGAYVVYRGLVKDPSGRRIWPTFVGIMLMDVAFELTATAANVYQYYGDHQPFQLFDGGWPAWVAPINAAGPVLGGVLMHLLLPRMRGVRAALVALLAPPFAYAATYGLTAWPTTTLLNSDVSEPVVWLGALVTIGFATAIVAVVTAVLGGRAPAASPVDAAASTDGTGEREGVRPAPLVSA